jgi:hypothetical protein
MENNLHLKSFNGWVKNAGKRSAIALHHEVTVYKSTILVFVLS